MDRPAKLSEDELWAAYDRTGRGQSYSDGMGVWLRLPVQAGLFPLERPDAIGLAKMDARRQGYVVLDVAWAESQGDGRWIVELQVEPNEGAR